MVVKENKPITGNTNRFFSVSNDVGPKEADAMPLGLTLAKPAELDPRKCPTYKSTATQNPTPRGDNQGDAGMDVDF